MSDVPWFPKHLSAFVYWIVRYHLYLLQTLPHDSRHFITLPISASPGSPLFLWCRDYARKSYKFTYKWFYRRYHLQWRCEQTVCWIAAFSFLYFSISGYPKSVHSLLEGNVCTLSPQEQYESVQTIEGIKIGVYKGWWIIIFKFFIL